MTHYYPPLVSGAFYHIYNRGNNRENIFYKPDNAPYFLKKYTRYLLRILDTYAYCLLPNHFHFLVRVKTAREILANASGLLDTSSMPVVPGIPDLPSLEDLEGLGYQEQPTYLQHLKGLVTQNDIPAIEKFIGEQVSEQFRLFFMAYAKAINKQENRVGSLFQKNFKRLRIESEEHLTNLVLYIHANPQLHGLCHDYRDWVDSSYGTVLSGGPTNLRRTEVLSWFGDVETFIARHREYVDWKMAGDFLIEDVGG